MKAYQQLEHFLKDMGMHPAGIELDADAARLGAAMAEGLSRHDAPLPMLASYIPATTRPPCGCDAVVIDAGGTHLRVARVAFDADGRPDIRQMAVHPMPGSQTPITADQLFDEVAAYVVPLVAGCRRINIGFCYSYVFLPTPARDGVMATLCKEVEVRGTEGLLAGQELKAALRRQGVMCDITCVVLNDTVAAMLGGRAVGDCRAGLVLGTGLNACYAERTEKITKLPHGVYVSPDMIINMECGLYNGFPRGLPEREVDARSLSPGDHLFEKQLSGAYFGAVLAATLRQLCRAGLLSFAFGDRLAQTESLDLRAVTQYIQGRDLENNFCEQLVDGHDGDRASFNFVLDKLYERAARMLAVLLGAIALQAGVGRDPVHPLKICAEGSTFYKSPLLLRHLKALLTDHWAARRNIYIETLQTENATLVGAALAALSE